MSTEADQRLLAALERRVLMRALASGEFGALHLRFDAGVLAKYRGAEGVRLIRTRSVGRLATPRFTLDFGIVPGDAEVHLSARDLLERVPEAERAHWAEHLVVQPASVHYLQMVTVPGACIDDGDAEPWD